jgi:F1F0 ATPase subunit 2
MDLPLKLGLSLLVGGVLGWSYFRALWSSVRRLGQQRRASGSFVASLAARLVLVLAGFVLLGRWGGGLAIGAALTGFIIARTVVVRRVRAAAPESGDAR